MPRLIRALYGPRRGVMQLPDDEAEQAIKDGWAADPNVPYTTPEGFDMAKAIKAAEKADERRLRGDAPVERTATRASSTSTASSTTAEKRTSEAADPDEKSSYQTRTAKPKGE